MTDTHRALHIAFVCDTVAGRLGGGVVSARNVIAGLRARHRVTVFASDATDRDDVRLSGFQLPLKAMHEMQFTMARPDRALLEQRFAVVDVVHVQFPFWLGIVAVDAARRAGRPVVAAFHVQPENALANVGIRSRWLSHLVYAHWVSRFFGRADAIVVPTPFAERKLRAHGLTRPVHVVSNGVPPDLRVPEAPEREPQHAGAFLVLSVGRFASEKRQDVILEAVRRCRHRDRIRLVLAGAGPLEEALRAKAQELPHPPEIGFLPRGRLARLLATADLFVHASEVELEGIAVLEAMSAGLPVLVAQSPESAASGLAVSDDFRFPAGDPAALAERIDTLIEKPSLLHDTRHFHPGATPISFEASVERLVEVYRSVLSPPGGPS